MSLRFRWKKINSTIGLRIAAGYSLLMLLSFLALMVITYFFLSATLARNDRDQVSVELQSLRAQYLDGGMDSFDQTVLKNDQFRPFFRNSSDTPMAITRMALIFREYHRNFAIPTGPSAPFIFPRTWL